MVCNEDILDLLLANGADINARNDEGVTLLHIVTDPDAIDLLNEGVLISRPEISAGGRH